MSNHLFFKMSTKMSDVILQNYSLLNVLPRFEINLGFGEATIEQLCKNANADSDLFLLVCNLYTFPNYTPATDRFTFKVDNLISYLLRSHSYYLADKIDSIEKHLNQIEPTHKEMLTKFFEQYKSEVINHFNYEEQEVFPYIERLTQGVVSPEYHIDRFEENHSNIEDKLGDLKNILIKYLPENSIAQNLRSELLFDLFLFEEELDKHTLIEEQVLIPYVERIERELANE